MLSSIGLYQIDTVDFDADSADFAAVQPLRSGDGLFGPVRFGGVFRWKSGMPVFRWGHSWEAFQDFEREVDRLLSSVNFAFQGIRLGRQYPSINLYELPDEYVLTAELPGTKADEIELALGNGVLKLKGRRSESNGVPEERYRRQERFRGEWERSLSIPERVREEGLTAEFVDGILRVHLPKGEQSQPRRIRVSEGGE